MVGVGDAPPVRVGTAGSSSPASIRVWGSSSRSSKRNHAVKRDPLLHVCCTRPHEKTPDPAKPQVRGLIVWWAILGSNLYAG